MRDTLLILHLIGAGSWLGANVTQAVVAPRMLSMSHEVAAEWLRSTVRMGQVLYTPAAILALITGILLVTTSNGAYSFASIFVWIGVAMVIAGALFGILVFGRDGRRAAELHEAGGSPDLPALHSRLRRFGILDTTLLVATITAMVLRLGA